MPTPHFPVFILLTLVVFSSQFGFRLLVLFILLNCIYFFFLVFILLFSFILKKNSSWFSSIYTHKTEALFVSFYFVSILFFLFKILMLSFCFDSKPIVVLLWVEKCHLALMLLSKNNFIYIYIYIYIYI